jgi:hypothetical protein
MFQRSNTSERTIIQTDDLKGLPLPVRKWLECAQIVGKEKIQSVRLKQNGSLRTKEDGPWMSAEAEQYFVTEEPGFIWKAKVRMAPFLFLSGLDHYEDGKGQMKIKLLSLFSVVDSKGPEIDQATLLRYLAEIQWFPTAALSKYISWEEIDSKSAKVVMTYKGIIASGVFVFNEQGDVHSFTAKRYMEKDGHFTLEDWGGVNLAYKDFNGIRIPVKSDIVWKLKSGDFTWYQLEITEVEFNKPSPFGS